MNGYRVLMMEGNLEWGLPQCIQRHIKVATTLDLKVDKMMCFRRF